MANSVIKGLLWANVFGLTGMLLSACHVRTPEFHCKLAGSSTENMELSMSPLALSFEERRFTFVEERGNQRLYRDVSQGRDVLFDLSSMLLTEYASPKVVKPMIANQSTADLNNRQKGEQLALAFQIDAPIVKQWHCERYKML